MLSFQGGTPSERVRTRSPRGPAPPLPTCGHVPPLTAMQTPVSGETGVRIGLVAGARFAPDSDMVPVATARWLYAGVKQGTREMVRVGMTA